VELAEIGRPPVVGGGEGCGPPAVGPPVGGRGRVGPAARPWEIGWGSPVGGRGGGGWGGMGWGGLMELGRDQQSKAIFYKGASDL